MSPEAKYILLMEAAYTATDKDTYYKLMQKADQVLKETQATEDNTASPVESRDSAADRTSTGGHSSSPAVIDSV